MNFKSMILNIEMFFLLPTISIIAISDPISEWDWITKIPGRSEINVFLSSGLKSKDLPFITNETLRMSSLNSSFTCSSKNGLEIEYGETFIIVPSTTQDSEVYLKMILCWAYQVRMQDLRTRKTFFFATAPDQSVSELASRLATLTRIVAADCCQYMFPTVMDNFYIVTPPPSVSEINVAHVYLLGRRDGAVLQIHPVPVVTSGSDIFLTKLYNLNGVSIEVVVTDSLSKELAFDLDPKTNRIRLLSGFCYDIIVALQDVLNFSITVTEYTEGISAPVDSSANAIGKALQDERKDIFIPLSTFAEQRARVFKILMPQRIRRIDAYFLQPKGSSLRDIYWQLFTPNLWTTLFATLVLLSLSKLIMEKIKRVYVGTEHVENHGSNILWTTAILTQQGWNEDPKSASLQIMFLSASVMGLICYVAFCANLVSALYFDPLPIKTFQELLQTSVRIAALENSGIIRNIIEGSTNAFRFDKEKATALKGKTDMYCSYGQGGKLIFSKEFAFLAYEDFKVFLINEYNRSGDDFCRNIGMLPINNLPLRSGMIATKNFPYRESFNQKLIQLMQTGLTYRYNRHFDMESSAVHCRIAAGLGRSVQLQLIDVYSAYLILILGKIFSLCILLLELMVKPRFVWENYVIH